MVFPFIYLEHEYEVFFVILSSQYHSSNLYFNFIFSKLDNQWNNCFKKTKKQPCTNYGKCSAYPIGEVKCVHALCEPTYAPICGDNGINYASQCWMERESSLSGKMIRPQKNEACRKLSFSLRNTNLKN